MPFPTTAPIASLIPKLIRPNNETSNDEDCYISPPLNYHIVIVTNFLKSNSYQHSTQIAEAPAKYSETDHQSPFVSWSINCRFLFGVCWMKIENRNWNGVLCSYKSYQTALSS
jgi:hypothetical protein